MQSLRQGGEQQSRFEKRFVRPDGATVWVRVNASAVVDRSGQPLYIVAQIEDLSEREAAEAALRVTNARFAALVEHSSDMTVVLGLDGSLLYTSPAAASLWDLPTVLPSTADPFALVHPDDLDMLRSAFFTTVAGDIPISPVWRARRADGSWRHFESHFTNLLADPAVGGIVVNSREVTERVQSADLLAHQAFHDSLTGLPNRILLSDRLSQALRRSQRSGRPTALLFLDLDRFKVINDSLGHAAGDELLRHVAKRLTTVVRPEDTVARVGGDEFVVLAEVADSDESIALAQRLIDAFVDPIPLPGGEDAVTTASIGVALSTEHDPEGLLRDADTALYRAKERGRDCYELFDDELRERAVRRHTTEQRLRRALDEDRFALGYQPIINLQTGKVVEAEALLRIDLGEPAVEVSEMIGVAEDSGLIVTLGARVLAEACRRAASWQKRLGPMAPGAISVNVAARQLSSTAFVDQVEMALLAAGLAPSRLCLELTEGTLFEAGRSTVNTLEELKALGVSLAIDDFGTGFSSLTYLKRFPLDYLKIDRSFVDGLGTDPGDTAIVRAVIGLGRALGLVTVAEGVETEGQLAPT